MPGRGRGRGRGRGAGRGRGRGAGRGRGGRGRGRGAWENTTGSGNSDEWALDNQTGEAEAMDIQRDAGQFFTAKATFEQHYDAQRENKERYAAALTVMHRNGVEISPNSRVRALAAAWSRKDHDLANTFLSNREMFGLVEVLKALTLLDSSRRIRVEEKKLKRLQTQGAKLKPHVLGKFKSNIDNLTVVRPKYGSASRAVCKHIAKWVRKFSKEDLEFFALHYPTEPWKKLADICHFNPTKDYPNLPWFLPFCFGEPAPDGTMVKQCQNVTGKNVNDLLKAFPIPYTHIKQHKDQLTAESKGRIAMSEKLDTILWWYEELQCKEVDEEIKRRLQEGEEVTLSNGKLLDRLLTIKMIREDIPKRASYWTRLEKSNPDPTKATFFYDLIPIAESRLENIKLPLEPPIVVVGDRSGSMEVAIRTSTIIAALLSAIVQAKLCFFNTQNMDADKIPKTITEVLDQVVGVSADGGTTPAASLWPFYERKEQVKTFIMVTDQEENGKCENMWFNELYDKYYKEVYPARLVFVSFLHHQHAEGHMVSKLNKMGYEPLQFKFHPSAPDLTKLDSLFGLLSAESSSFVDQLNDAEKEIRAHGMSAVFEQLSITVATTEK